jgi:alkylmercury lyase
VTIEVLYFDGCPSHEALLPRLRELLSQAGVDEEIQLRRVESIAAAEQARFLGSPTVRVNGHDVEPGASERDDFGLKCRLYPGEERMSGVPPDDWVLAALRRAAGSDPHSDEPLSHEPDLARLADTLASAGLDFDDADQEMAIRLLRLLAEGHPVPSARLAQAAGLPEEHVAGTLERWPGVFRDEHGAVIGFMGLTVVEMGAHRLHNEGGPVLSAWCAWDTLFLPELLGETVRVTSRCAATSDAISLTVGPEGVCDLSPAEAVVSFLVPETGFDADVIQRFCHFVHFFASADAGATWTAENDRTFLLSVDDAFELGRLTNRAAFGTALAAQQAA